MPEETAKREREMDEDNAGKAEEVEEGDKRETKTASLSSREHRGSLGKKGRAL